MTSDWLDVVFTDDDFVLQWIDGTRSLPDGPALDVPEREGGREPVGFE